MFTSCVIHVVVRSCMCVHVIVVASHCEFLVDKGAITHSHTEHIKVVYCDGDEANEQNQTAVVRHSFWP